MSNMILGIDVSKDIAIAPIAIEKPIIVKRSHSKKMSVQHTDVIPDIEHESRVQNMQHDDSIRFAISFSNNKDKSHQLGE